MSAVRISDHALLRFMDRAGGVGIEQLRDRLTASLGRAFDAAESLGISDYLVKADGHVFVVRKRIVTTVIAETSPGESARILVQGGETR